jgi:hypothetical protein
MKSSFIQYVTDIWWASPGADQGTLRRTGALPRCFVLKQGVSIWNSVAVARRSGVGERPGVSPDLASQGMTATAVG